MTTQAELIAAIEKMALRIDKLEDELFELRTRVFELEKKPWVKTKAISRFSAAYDCN